MARADTAFGERDSVLAQFVKLILLGLACLSIVYRPGVIWSEDVCRVDVPAIATAHELLDPFVDSPAAGERLVALDLAVSLRCAQSGRQPAYSYEIEVVWVRSLYPLVDYWPKTTMHSSIHGLIEIERNSEKSATASLATQKALTSFPATAEIGGAIKEQFKRHYAEIPEREPMISSGTIERGTGAFVRFHNTPQQTLEGGRKLTLVFRVPSSWRGGLLRIKTKVVESNPNVFSWSPISPRIEMFIVPVYLEGDNDAHDAAIVYSQTEADVKSLWKRFVGHRRTGVVVSQLVNWTRAKPSAIDQAEFEQLLYRSESEISDRVPNELPAELSAAISKFSEARARILALSQ